MAPRILFVRSGGGFPGLDIHAGIWLALEDRGIRPTDVAGTSAGAVISACQAAGMKPAVCAGIVTGLRDRDVRQEVPCWKVRIPWLDHFLDPQPIRDLLAELLPASFDRLTMPLAAWATRMDTGDSVNVADPRISKSVQAAVLASMSICGVFPPVVLADGLSYIDGGVRRNLPLPPDWTRYDQVWLLIASGRPRDYAGRGGILTHLFRNVHYLMHDQILDVLDTTIGFPTVHVVWPQVRTPRGMLRFDHDRISDAYRATLDVLDRTGGTAQ